MRPGLFERLPVDVIENLLSHYLHLHGPSVKLIDGEPSEEEKQLVTATALDLDADLNSKHYGEADQKRPDLSTYHLIAHTSSSTREIVYKIGFCKKASSNSFSLEYKIQTLDAKSPLLRYVTEDLTHPVYSKLFPYNSNQKANRPRSSHQVLLKYMEEEIRKAGGLTCHRLRNRTRLAAICTRDNALMNARVLNREGKISTKQIVKHSILQELFKDLCAHESFHETKKAREILERFPQLLDSQFSGDIVGCSPELTLHGFTIIQKAYLQGNWFFYEMALEVIEQSTLLTEDQKGFYKKGLLAQIAAVDEGRMKWTKNNLLNKGVRIINADTLAKDPPEKKRFIDEVVACNSYHLIIKKEGEVISSCTLGHRDPETKEYILHEISKNDPLFAIAEDLYQRLENANDGYGNRHTHCFTRDHRDLALVQAVLDQLKVPTRLCQIATPLNFSSLLASLKEYIKNWKTWSLDRQRDYLHGSIYSECRLFSGILWQFWMSADLPSTSDEDSMRRFVTNKAVGAVGLNYFEQAIFPFSSFFGDKFHASSAWRGRGAAWVSYIDPVLIKIYLEGRASKADRFHRRLTGQPEPDQQYQQQSSCWLM